MAKNGFLTLREMRPEDWPAIRAIYQNGIETGDATFETAAPDWPKWDSSHLAACRFVAEIDGETVGFAVLSPVSARAVYAGVAESSLYIKAARRGVGIGKALLAALVESSEAAGFWTLQASIFPENAASLAVHEKAGFRRIGHRERVAEREGRWRDAVLMERRSRRVAWAD